MKESLLQVAPLLLNIKRITEKSKITIIREEGMKRQGSMYSESD